MKIGELRNKVPRELAPAIAALDACSVLTPARVDTLLCKTQYFINPPSPNIYPVGSVNFVVKQFTLACVRRNDSGIIVVAQSKRSQIIMHVALIMKEVLKFDDGLTIKVKTLHNVVHGGLGSTIALASAVAVAINEIYGAPLNSEELLQLVSQNYGEECDSPYELNESASIGGGVASAVYPGNVKIMQCDTGCVFNFHLPEEYKVVSIIPPICKMPSGAEDHDLFTKGQSRLRVMGEEYGEARKLATNDKVIRSLIASDYKELLLQVNKYTAGHYGNVAEYFSNRWIDYGIDFNLILKNIEKLLFGAFERNECAFFVSSGGPLICVITRDAGKVTKLLGDVSGEKHVFELHNTASKVLRKVSASKYTSPSREPI